MSGTGGGAAIEVDASDHRLRDVIALLGEAPLEDVSSILDVGAGRGELARYFASLGKQVTCTGLAVHSYLPEPSLRAGIEYVECDIEQLPFADAAFDAVVLSHVLEHCPNVAFALRQVRRVLREDGLLMIFVPPHEDTVCAGHVSVGWNVGQLIYVLLLNGFDVRSGMFIEQGYNVCAFVRPCHRILPRLRADRGDIALLSENGHFPVQVRGQGANGDAFLGLVKSVNWPHVERYATSDGQRALKRLVVYAVATLVPRKLKKKMGAALVRFGRMLLRLSVSNPEYLE